MQKYSNKGLTLIEIMIVLIIISLLTGIIVTNLSDRPDEAKVIKAKADIKMLSQALRLYKLDNGYYPTTEQGLDALVSKPTIGNIPDHWREGGYIEDGIISLDPWDNEYIYLCPGIKRKDYDLYSLGKDGAEGGQGFNADITNWKKSDDKADEIQ